MEETTNTTTENTIVDEGSNESVEEQATHTAETHGAEVMDNGEKVEGNEEQTATHKNENDEKTNKEDKKDDAEGIEQEIADQKQAEADAKKQIADAGLDWDALSKEYEENGALSDASMDALNKAGFPPSLVHAYLRGMEATAMAYRDAVFKLAGGEEEFKHMADFVESLGMTEIRAFNRAIETGDLSQLNNMFIGYKSRMVKKNGTFNSTILGSGPVSTQGGYANKAAMVKAMSDPRYGTDPDYTGEVQNKVMRSSFLNGN